MTALRYIPVARSGDVPLGGAKLIEVGGETLLLCNSDGHIFAVANRCSHMDADLACGRVKAGWIACPAHGARFDLATGEPLNPPATAAIRTYPVRILSDMIEIAIV